MRTGAGAHAWRERCRGYGLFRALQGRPTPGTAAGVVSTALEVVGEAYGFDRARARGRTKGELTTRGDRGSAWGGRWVGEVADEVRVVDDEAVGQGRLTSAGRAEEQWQASVGRGDDGGGRRCCRCGAMLVGGALAMVLDRSEKVRTVPATCCVVEVQGDGVEQERTERGEAARGVRA